MLAALSAAPYPPTSTTSVAIHTPSIPNHPQPLPIPTMSTTPSKLKAAIIIISETASRDPSTDKCDPRLRDVFAKSTKAGSWELVPTRIVPDDVLQIQRNVVELSDEGGDGDGGAVNLIVTSGGTGFAVKDVTPEVSGSVESWCDHGMELCGDGLLLVLDVLFGNTDGRQAVRPLIHKHAPGLVHAMLASSLAVTPFAAMARPVAVSSRTHVSKPRAKTPEQRTPAALRSWSRTPVSLPPHPNISTTITATATATATATVTVTDPTPLPNPTRRNPTTPAQAPPAATAAVPTPCTASRPPSA
ncbi:hypothetical protein M8818_000938 [Zalaria obscura]|uniref:Uncharacterized protein n=1 Tax=Zalaria obscura TaxID=2024903 RepID=A0ACC3SLV9_9PEZI